MDVRTNMLDLQEFTGLTKAFIPGHLPVEPLEVTWNIQPKAFSLNVYFI